MKNRKAFNFYRSYYEVAVELPEQDRNEFVWSIVSAQFTGTLIEPKSKLARLMFLGQKHSILKQLEGFKFATETPPKGTPKGANEEPYLQVQGQVQGQDKEQEKGGFDLIEINRVDGVNDFITIQPKIIGKQKYRIWGVDGLNTFYQMNRSLIPYPEHAAKFMQRNKGKPFEDFKHIFNSFNLFVKDQYK